MAGEAKKKAKGKAGTAGKRVEKKAATKKSAAAAPAKESKPRPAKKAAVLTKAAKTEARKTTPAKKAATAKRATAKRYNAGPERGDNSFPPGNKGNKGFKYGGEAGGLAAKPAKSVKP